MEHQQEFIEKIQDVVSLAKLNKREVTKEFIKDFLKDLNLQEEQMTFVYEYLAQENIKVSGYEGKNPEPDREETEPEVGYKRENKSDKDNHTVESEHLSFYEEELKRAGSCNQVERELYDKAAAGDAQAKAFIIEQKLSRVMTIAQKFTNQGLALGDLIQEGNIGLLLAVEMLEGKAEEADVFLDEAIEDSILQAIDLYKEEKKENRGLMQKAENLKDEMEKLSEDFGDKMTSEDVAQFTGMDIDEIQDILRMTGEDV